LEGDGDGHRQLFDNTVKKRAQSLHGAYSTAMNEQIKIIGRSESLRFTTIDTLRTDYDNAFKSLKKQEDEEEEEEETNSQRESEKPNIDLNKMANVLV